MATAAAPLPDKNYRHYVLGVLTLTYFMNFTDRQVLSVLLEDIKLEFALTDTQLGLLSGLAFALFYSTLGIPIARLADRANRMKIVAGAAALWSLATAAGGLAGNFFHLFLARIFVGVGEAGCAPPTMSALADYYRRTELARAIGILTAAAPGGAICGVILGGYIAEHYGWRSAFFVVGLPGLLVAALIFFTVREPGRGRLSQTAMPEKRPPFTETVRRLFSNPVFVAVALGNALAVMVAYVGANWGPPLYARVFGLSGTEIGLYAALGIIIGGLPGTVVGGLLNDQLIKHDARWQCWLPATGLIICCPLLMLAPFGTTALMAALIFAAGSFFANLCLGPAAALVQAIVHPSERAVAASLFILLSSGLGIGVGPVLTGVISDALTPAFGIDALRYAISIMSGSALVAALFFWWGARALGRAEAAEAIS